MTVTFGSILSLAALPAHAHRPRSHTRPLHYHTHALLDHSYHTLFSALFARPQLLQQQQTHNHTSFAYLSSDVNSKGPLSVSLSVVCPSVTANVNASTDVGIPVAIALAVVIFVAGIAYGIRQVLTHPVITVTTHPNPFQWPSRQYAIKRTAVRQQRMKKMDELVAAAKRAEEETKKAEADQERERRLRHELQENIVNSAHDIKSPTTALGIAVESLLDALDNTKPITEAGRQQLVETLHGMAHTIDTLTMIINRSVDASKSASGSFRSFIPNNVPVGLSQILDGVMAFSKWQSEDTGIEVVMEPLPADLPDEILMDEKWLKDDLLCVASNAIKFSRANQGVPALMRVAIVPSAAELKANLPSPPSVQFSFIDSGYPLSDEKLTSIFDRPVHSERMQTGGMGLGLFCLSEHIQALQGQYGARKRTDGREGTEIWFSFPLIVPDGDEDQFVMSDVGNGTRGPKTNHNRSLGVVSMNGVNNTVVKAADKSLLFSSPQNHRPSVLRTVFVPLDPTQATIASLNATDSISGGAAASVGVADDPSLRGSSSKRPFLNSSTRSSTKSVKNVQEVLGALPILLVDDSVAILKMTKRAIQNECADISFMEAKNGEEAFELVVKVFASFELIITDIQMPICNGFEFTRRVRQLEREKGLTPKLIIGISANDHQKISIEAKESGRAYHILPYHTLPSHNTLGQHTI